MTQKKGTTQTSETSTTILMLAYLCVHPYPYLPYPPQKVGVLDRFGFYDTDIATVLGCTVKQVKEFRAQNEE